MSAEQIYNLLYFQLPLSGSRDLLVVFLKMVPSELNFQLPLSGSQENVANMIDYVKGLYSFQLPLSGSHNPERVLARAMRAFQLPLSGSPSCRTAKCASSTLQLSTPSLGITWRLSRRGISSRRLGFQLPLSGSLGALSSPPPGRAPVLPFQLPLSGSLIVLRPSFLTVLRNFQLPLSGSRALVIFTLSSPPSQFFQLPLSGSPQLNCAVVVLLDGYAFNSLSRDHLAKRKSTTIDVYSRFQLPLSGSQIAELFNHEGLRAPELSTPSLGITVFKPFVQNVLRFILLSTPSLGITYWCHGCPGFGSSGRAFQLPLSGSRPGTLHDVQRS